MHFISHTHAMPHTSSCLHSNQVLQMHPTAAVTHHHGVLDRCIPVCTFDVHGIVFQRLGIVFHRVVTTCRQTPSGGLEHLFQPMWCGTCILVAYCRAVCTLAANSSSY
jgi:hypothetical protein